MTWEIDTRALEAACARSEAKLEFAIGRALQSIAKTAHKSLKSTDKFQNRTGALRASFIQSGSGFLGSITVEVDPSALGRRFVGSKGRTRKDANVTPPTTYARFLEFGTETGIAPRGFGGTARNEAVEMAGPELIAALQKAIG